MAATATLTIEKSKQESTRSGFLLIYLLIGFITLGSSAGGMLICKQLIESAAIKAQISQIERFDEAISPDKTYNSNYRSTPLCHIAIALTCCKAKED